MHQQEVELVLVQLKFHLDMGREGSEVSTFIGLYDLVGLGDGDSAVCLLLIGLVSAAAVVAGAADAEVIVAGDGRDAAAANFANDFVWPAIVTDEVAKAIDGVGFTGVYVFKQGFEGREVSVNVAE